MKITIPKQLFVWAIILLSVLILQNSNIKSELKEEKGNVDLSIVEEIMIEEVEEKKPVVEVKKDPVVYDGLTKKELVAKIERSLNSTIQGIGDLFVTHALEVGVDPYVALAIVLEETGCVWECSTLVQECNNIGGQVGSPSCGNGPYKAFASLEEGVKAFLDNLSRNYYQQGLNTPELMNQKYASSKTWAAKVNRYVEKIKAA